MLAKLAKDHEPKAVRPVGSKRKMSPQQRLEEKIKAAALMGVGTPIRKTAVMLNVSKGMVQQIRTSMKEDTPQGEILRKAAQEAREAVAGEAMGVLRLAINKAKTQITKGVRTSKGYSEPPLAHVAQAVRSLSDVAMYEPHKDEIPTADHPRDRVQMTAGAMADLLLKVRDHEQAKGRVEIDVTPKKEIES